MRIKFKDDAPSNALHNILGVGTTVKGDIITDGDFRLNGRVEGNINCAAKIVIGPKGHIDGDIVSVNAEILGTVVGSIRTSGALVLKASSIVTGDIYAQTLEIEPNAKFSGVCNMLPSEDKNA
ncbi:cytoskeletal protein CcmA (bactofilin family) [Parabacteroides sp. PF5-5]|uniref:bactofilin family protein n=1 Tax=unclassified Parabacteroides TaxID=2649774 RepID=UPI002476FC34|nr:MULTISPECIES: polymer-forming cytoskeletal protein [unclassified Parabacteroides]MDH6304524.1 cytoskeletal protein CcmA (bactofilin family) [Parabacteroides sp. PH5-39]MDH6315324.1 cytoskeletal protein CcmA (bactofilin family) [Parabacteroides sp. PF5-13]MDH6319182.1 cytoskeletal protein CcmA (bactofilin family) [Parabacteroides sp. PH5-13]MDH6322913.1 cytoskeletal protein CcmA (bactofilin family) [Parabacteroides sp. PH5-8]MDH6326515.1 cytoskeletal protein CcmA (bactofilin family) [Parabac